MSPSRLAWLWSISQSTALRILAECFALPLASPNPLRLGPSLSMSKASPASPPPKAGPALRRSLDPWPLCPRPLDDLSAAMDALPDMLPAAGEREGMAVTGTDGKNSGPNLGPRLAKTADSGGQARTEKAKTSDDGNHGKIKVSACFPG